MKVEDYLNNLCKHLGLTDDQFSVEIEETDDVLSAKIVLPEEESGLFIGYHGETLQAIQRMIRVSFYDELGEKRFQLNVNDYREQRQDKLEERVEKIARRVLETGESYTFPYLSSHDRFLIHTILSAEEEFSELVSESSGEGRERLLTIKLKQQDE